MRSHLRGNGRIIQDIHIFCNAFGVLFPSFLPSDAIQSHWFCSPWEAPLSSAVLLLLLSSHSSFRSCWCFCCNWICGSQSGRSCWAATVCSTVNPVQFMQSLVQWVRSGQHSARIKSSRNQWVCAHWRAGGEVVAEWGGRGEYSLLGRVNCARTHPNGTCCLLCRGRSGGRQPFPFLQIDHLQLVWKAS